MRPSDVTHERAGSRVDRRSLARIFVTDRRRVDDGDLLASILRATRSGAATAAWIRELDLPFEEQVGLARATRAAVAPEIPVFVARDPEVARAAGADGVVLGWNSPSIAAARERLGPAAIVGRSTHGVDEAVATAAAGADFVVFGPIRDVVKRGAIVEGVGFDALRSVVERCAAPVVAIGGLRSTDAAALSRAGAAGFAAIGDFVRSEPR